MTRIPLESRLEPGRVGEIAPPAVVIVGALLLVLLAFLPLIIWGLRHSGGRPPGGPATDEGSNGGGPYDDGPRDGRPPSPKGGIPLLDATPAPVRLRGQSARDLSSRPARRRVREPARPASRPRAVVVCRPGRGRGREPKSAPSAPA